MAGAISNLQVYSIASIFITSPSKGTILLAEEGSVTLDRSTASNPVKTVQKGYAGESPGAGMTEVSVESAVPAADFEFEAGQLMADLTPVKFTIFAANSTLQFDGFIISDTFSHSVDGEAKLSFKARGGLATWSGALV